MKKSTNRLVNKTTVAEVGIFAVVEKKLDSKHEPQDINTATTYWTVVV